MTKLCFSKLFIILLQLFLVNCLYGLTVHAQTGGVVVTHVATVETTDNVQVSAFFTIIDANGRPLTSVDIDSATIEVLGGLGEPTEAEVIRANTRINVALLLDGSGSMADVIGDVREAAKSALGDAPPNAHFAVFQFNEVTLEDEFRPLQNFTNDRNLVASAIDAVRAEPSAPTCLYNALSKAMEALDEQVQGPEERRAIIIFTDGKDERANGSACSQLNYDDAVYRANRNVLARTPIHTIGLCSDDRCSNLNSPELQRLSRDTLGFSAIGGQTNLGGLFQEIMEGLNSQWVARASVCTSPGTIEAVLKAQTRDSSFPPASFGFATTVDCRKAATPADMRVTALTYNADNYDPNAPQARGDYFDLGLNIISPEQIQRIIVTVWDASRGTQVLESVFPPDGTGQTIRVETARLEAGREYRIEVQATDNNNVLIRKPVDDSGTRDPAPLVLATHEFVYTPPEKQPPQPIAFVIEPPTPPDWQNNQITLQLDIPAADLVDTYKGFISDGTGQKIDEFGPFPYMGTPQIQLPLPDAMWQSRCNLKFAFTIELTSIEGPRSQQTYDEFSPCRPNLINRMQIWIRNNPGALATIIGFLISCLVVWFLYTRWREQRKPPELLPPVAHTEAAPAFHLLDETPRKPKQLAAPATPSSDYGDVRLRLKIIKSPQVSLTGEVILEGFPYTIGRDEFRNHLEIFSQGSKRFLNIAGDEKISRNHIEITVRNGQFYLTDLQSSNGTTIDNKKAEPLKPIRLAGFTTIKLGKRTHIELEPMF